MDEIVPINKPVGMTSHDVVNSIRRITSEQRVGHAGTLDPLASGVLIVLIGRNSTRRQAEFMNLPKAYDAELTFGSTSATDDAEGPLTQTATLQQLQTLTAQHIVALLPKFIGTVEQQPPIYSAIKIAGTPLYKHARRGTIAPQKIPPRTVQIDSIKLLQFIPATASFPPKAHLCIHCHRGTYIRSLARDIGKALGIGAYLSQLQRIAVGDFTLNNSLTLEQFKEKWNNTSTNTTS